MIGGSAILKCPYWLGVRHMTNSKMVFHLDY
jgi:hypothetical protein